jgi:hypothetical protein
MTVSRSNFGRKIIDPPARSVMFVATNSPWVWKIGSACNRTSLPVKRQVSARTSALDRRLPCVSIAPFERPVVPEV